MISWIQLQQTIEYFIRQYHCSIFKDIPLSGIYWEAILKKAFEFSDCVVDWAVNSHRIGYDLGVNGFKISCKSGRLNRYLDRKCYVISSHRLGKHETLEDKINFLNFPLYDYHFCLVLLENKNDFIRYRLVVINKQFFNYTLNWNNVITKDGRTTNTLRYFDPDNKFIAEIRPTMSHQLWLFIPEENINKSCICDIGIKKS